MNTNGKPHSNGKPIASTVNEEDDEDEAWLDEFMTGHDLVEGAQATRDFVLGLLAKLKEEVTIQIGRAVEAELAKTRAAHQAEIAQLRQELWQFAEHQIADVKRTNEYVHEKGLERLITALRTLPPVQVLVPPESILVEPQTPNINLSVPKEAIALNISHDPLEVNVVQKGRVRKEITYDPGSGRPASIVESLEQD